MIECSTIDMFVFGLGPQRRDFRAPRNRCALASALLVALVSTATIPTRARAEEVRLIDDLPLEFVEKTMAVAREQGLPKAKLADGSLVGNESKEERKLPIISVEDGERIMHVAVASAMAEWCGVEWTSANFQKLMIAERARGDRSDKAISYVAVLHGVTKGMFQNEFGSIGTCPDDQRHRVQEYMRRRWQ